MAFDQTTRNRLQSFVSSARNILSQEFTRQLQADYGMDPKQGTVDDLSTLTHLNNSQRQTAQLLRDTLEHYLATTPGKSDKERTKQVLERIIREQAFTVLNRLAALRMAEAREFLIESIGKSQSSKGFQLYRQLAGTSHGETGDAYRNYLFSLFDEFSVDLAVLFDRHSIQGRLFPRESALLELLAEINHQEIDALWAEDETIGWIYQYFNSQEERKKMRAESQAPRNSRELAVRNQFFTPRYVVEFLTDNTLGRIWYEMTQGKTALVDCCSYLVRRPTEIFLQPSEQAPDIESTEDEALSQEELLQQPVYIPYRKLKDPRSIRMLDPACGSMHFGLYAFDLFEQVYLEAWHLEQELGPDAFQRESNQQSLQVSFNSLDEFRTQIPKLIIENNIHGVDIDPRAVQIAGLSLWQRAQRAWQLLEIKPQQRPVIVKSNIVCAEPMPGDKALLQEFTSKLNPPVLGQLLEVVFDKMQLAGEAGTLLKIEEELQIAIKSARNQWQKQSGRNSVNDMFQSELDAATPQKKLGFDLRGIDDATFWDDAEQLILMSLSNYADSAESDAEQKRLFAEDAAKGFAFIDLCRKKFDIVLMNPPFGEASANTQSYIYKTYPHSKGNVLANFIERADDLLTSKGEVGAITSRSFLYLTSMADFRERVILDTLNIKLCVDMGDGVLDAMVETAAYILSKQKVKQSLFFRCLVEDDKETKIRKLCLLENDSRSVFINSLKSFKLLAESPFTYWVSEPTLEKLNSYGMLEEKAKVAVGLQTGDDFRFYRNFWEVPIDEINKNWYYTSKTETAAAWYSPLSVVVNWKNDGYELFNFFDKNGKLKSRPQNVELYFSPGFSYMARSTRLVPYIIPRGCIPVAPRAQVFPHKGYELEVLAVCASNLGASIARFRGESFARPLFQAGMVQKINFKRISEVLTNSIEGKIIAEVKAAKEFFSNDETTLEFSGFNYTNSHNAVPLNLYSLLGEENDTLVAEEYGLSEEEYKDTQLDLQQAVSLRKVSSSVTSNKNTNISAAKYISYLVGCIFGRWDISFNGKPVLKDVYEELPNQPLAAKVVTFPNYVEKHGIADIESSFSLTENINSIEPEIDSVLTSCGVKSLETFLTRASLFFEFHLNQYTKNRRPSPIYWPLQSASGSYTLWVYYHRLNKQTLYTCVNDFLEGPAGKLTQVEQDLHALKNLSTRSNQEEEDLTRLTDLAAELKDFRDELLRLARFWKPNLNDGVQITAAPLWKLFQHKAWQKRLKDTWEKLEEGDYDWAHLACSIWPERVLRKCHQDRSLAIAHDVEDIFWHEVEVPVKRGKKLTGEMKIEWQPKSLTATELTELINQTIADLK